MRKLNKVIIVSLSAVFIFMVCSNIPINETDTGEIVISKPITEEKPFSDEEVEAIVRTLAGECYDDKMSDKRKVVEVIIEKMYFGQNINVQRG